MKDIFEITGPEPIETVLFMNSFYDTDDAASFVDSYRNRLLEGLDHTTALTEIAEIYGIEVAEFTSLISADQSPTQPSS